MQVLYRSASMHTRLFISRRVVMHTHRDAQEYYIGVPVTDEKIVSAVQKPFNKVRSSFGESSPQITECHMTLVPPFRFSYEAAAEVSAGCSVARILKKHPLREASLCIQELDAMTWGTETILHFPVTSQDQDFEKFDASGLRGYVNALRKKVRGMDGFSWVNPVPPFVYLHITVASLQGTLKSSLLTEMVEQSKTNEKICFSSSFATLYIRGACGWEPFLI